MDEGLKHARRVAGTCQRCGEHPRTDTSDLCRYCGARHYERDRRLRQRRIDEARRIREQQAARALRTKREVVIDGVTFIVQNDY